MKRYLFILIFIFLAMLRLSGQGLIEMPLPLPDSTAAVQGDLLRAEPELLLNAPLAGEMALPLPLIEEVKLPKFDFNKNLFLGMKPDYSFFNGTANFFDTPGGRFLGFNPFVRNAFVFNQAAYKISDRLSLGGNSFGGNLPFSAPFPKNGFNNFDFRGASMFMQYKVSKNIKIETRVTVTNGGM